MMKTKLTKKTKKAICIYLIALLTLYVVVEVLPKVTDIFETTQILEPGNLRLSYETTGYFIKDESIGMATETGSIEYLVEEGTAVKKGFPLAKVEKAESDKNMSARFGEYMVRLKGFDGLAEGCNAPISGVFSLHIDGYEDYFTPEKMEKIKRDTVEGLSYKTADLDRNSVIKDEPMFKVSCDDIWYILCWVDEKTGRTYKEGKSVTLELPEGSVKARIQTVKKEDRGYRVIFYLDVYYADYANSRAEDMSIITSDNEGLIIDNKCIIEKNGQLGVYVVNKNGNYVFTRVKVIASDEKQSVIDDVTFYDEEGYQVYTVDVYDEVLKNPESALEKDLKREAEEAKEAEKSEKEE